MIATTLDEPETLSLEDFQPSYSYSEDEIDFISFPDYLELKYKNEVIKRVNLPAHLHQRYFVSYRKDLKRKLETLKPYLSAIESFLVMVANRPAFDDVECEIKCEKNRA